MIAINRRRIARFSFAAILLCTLAVAGCEGDKGKELFDTAKFEEVQQNKEHAVKLYREIVKKYPGTEYAEKAAQRLAVLDPRK